MGEITIHRHRSRNRTCSRVHGAAADGVRRVPQEADATTVRPVHPPTSIGGAAAVPRGDGGLRQCASLGAGNVPPRGIRSG